MTGWGSELDPMSWASSAAGRRMVEGKGVYNKQQVRFPWLMSRMARHFLYK